MTDLTIFRKMHFFQAAVLLYQSSLEHKKICKIKRDTIVYLVIKLTKAVVSAWENFN